MGIISRKLQCPIQKGAPLSAVSYVHARSAYYSTKNLVVSEI